MVDALFSFSLATLALAISPGPDNIYVITQSLVNGTKSGIATTAGLISGCIVHTALLAFGVSALITASESIFYLIKIFGALYLFYLAYGVTEVMLVLLFREMLQKNLTGNSFGKVFL
jgi:threonine/homoserine/homoserine lactone efflux protein